MDETLFSKKLNPRIMIAQIYVDDFVFGSTSLMHVQEFIDQIKNEFEMSMVGELTYYISFQVKQLENGIFISQSKYGKNLEKEFTLDSAKHMRTLMSTNLRLIKDNSGSSVDPSLYRSIIGRLLYLTTSRLDICFHVGVCARYEQIQRNLIYLLLNESFVLKLLMIEFSVLKTLIQVLEDIAMLIGQVILMTKKASLEVVFILVTILYLGIVRNKNQFLYLLVRPNMLLLVIVILNYLG